MLGVISTLNLDDYGVEDIGKIELVIPNAQRAAQEDKKANILINGKKLEINQFTNNIVANSISAMVKSLKTENDIKTVDVEISGICCENVIDAEIDLKANGDAVAINKFTRGILKETIFAIISTLKIDDEISSIKIRVEGD